MSELESSVAVSSGNGLTQHLTRLSNFQVTKVLTRRHPDDRNGFEQGHLLTESVRELVDHCDIVVECSGDVFHAANVITEAFEAELPVVTMNAEFQVTLGSWFVSRGYLTEAEGDQPGCLAALNEDATRMGFRPIVFGNMKRFMNHHPERRDMIAWATKQGLRLDRVTSFTDGTKIQIEQALVANGLEVNEQGVNIVRRGMLGASEETFELSVSTLSAEAHRFGGPISDYVLHPDCVGGVFIVGEHDPQQHDALRYLRLGDGPDYVLSSNYHLCHLEIPKTLRRVAQGEPPLLNNSTAPRVGVAAVAKRKLKRGTMIEKGIGGFDVRGVACPTSLMA